MEGGIAIHLAPSALFHIGSFTVTNTLVTAVTVSVLLILGAFLATRSLKLKPGKFQSVLELIITFPHQFVRETLQNDKVADRIFPIVMTIFLFVLAVNWFGLLPFVGSIGTIGDSHGGHGLVPYFYPGATDLNFTLMLAFVAFFTIEVLGIATLGAAKYAGKFITFKSPLAFAIGIIELVTEFARLISFSFRLFGNIFAGKVLILVAMFFMPLFLPIPILAFELVVGLIQAAIFALLTLFFTRSAISLHEEHDEHPASDVDGSHPKHA